MNEINLTKSNFDDEILNYTGTALIDFWAPWCGPCKMISPIISEIATDFKGTLKVGKVNVDEQTELAVEYEISSIPTLIILKDKKIIKKIIGYHSKQELVDIIKSI